MSNFLRTNVYASMVLLLVRVYLGWQWMTAGWGKITGDGFNAGGFLKGAVANPVVSHDHVVYPNYVAFLEKVAIPNADLFSMMVAYGEFLVGLGLLLGVLTTWATFFGVVMNFAFLYAGTVSSNPFMVMLSILLIVAGANAGKFGGDYYVLPYLKTLLKKKDKSCC